MAKILLASLLVLGLIAGILRYGLVKSDFDYSAPIVYAIDGILTATMVQGLVENDYFPPGVIQARRLGAPGHMNLGDFPTFDGFHLLIIRGIALFTSKPFLICNIYYILTFFLSGLIFLWSARAFGIRFIYAIAGAVLFAFGHYRILRFQHLFLSAYYLMPALIWVIAQNWSEKLLLFKERDGKMILDWKDKRLLPVLIIVAIGGWSGIYFAAFFLVIATACAAQSAIFYRSSRRFISSIFPVAALFVSFVICAAPNLVHRSIHGKASVGIRQFGETEILSLTLPEALLPVAGNANIPWVNEHIAHKYKPLLPGTDAAYIGAWASLGFCVVVLFGLFNSANIPQSLPTQIGFMSVVLLLYALRGGFGLMFSIMISPQIRSLSRIVVFMAPLGLLGISGILSTSIKRKWLIVTTGLAMLLTGIVDQVPYRSLTNHPDYLTEFRKDQLYFQNLEKELPIGSSVFQLPVMEFPEGIRIGNILDYDQLRPYLNTKRLRWSAGAPSQRETIKFLKTLSEMPLDVSAIKQAGFASILIDNLGYEDKGLEIQKFLGTKLKSKPIRSDDGRWVTFLIGT